MPALVEGQGAYPTDVLAALRNLERGGNVVENRSGFWMRTDSTLQTAVANVSADELHLNGDDSDFPEPHPLDFDWRFGRRALELLDQRIVELGCRKWRCWARQLSSSFLWIVLDSRTFSTRTNRLSAI